MKVSGRAVPPTKQLLSLLPAVVLLLLSLVLLVLLWLAASVWLLVLLLVLLLCWLLLPPLPLLLPPLAVRNRRCDSSCVMHTGTYLGCSSSSGSGGGSSSSNNNHTAALSTQERKHMQTLFQTFNTCLSASMQLSLSAHTLPAPHLQPTPPSRLTIVPPPPHTQHCHHQHTCYG